MDWKTYYNAELLTPGTRAEVEDLLSLRTSNDSIDALVSEGAIMSFPHTAAAYAAPLQARVVASLYRLRVKRVIALGVLHTSALSAPFDEQYRTVIDGGRSDDERRRAWGTLRGAFMPDVDEIDTAFGALSLRPLEIEGTDLVRSDKGGITAREFSLDTFFSLLVRHSQLHAIPQIPVTALYVGMTRDPIDGSFAVADGIADYLRTVCELDTAIVTTGDVVHYGTAYPAKGKIEERPTHARELEAFFRMETEKTLSLALEGKNLGGAFERSTEVLQNDQRYILPVISAYLGGDAGFRIFSFSLSDYATILGVSPPCYVASALVAFIPALSCFEWVTDSYCK
jgi:hypothetical protein